MAMKVEGQIRAATVDELKDGACRVGTGGGRLRLSLCGACSTWR